MRLIAAVGCLGLLLAVCACGDNGAASSSTTTASSADAVVKLRQHLKANGYTAIAVPHQPHQTYDRAIEVSAVDWTSPHAFDVYMYVYPSAAQAKSQASKVIKTGRFPMTNRWTQVSNVVFVGTTDVAGGLTCTIVNGQPKCPIPPRVPRQDFLQFVANATQGLSP